MKDYKERVGGQVAWCPMVGGISLTKTLVSWFPYWIFLCMFTFQRKVGLEEFDGCFSVPSFLSFFTRGSLGVSPLYRQWKLKDPPRITTFGWLALCDCVFAMDNLRRHKRIIVNACLLCPADEEIVNHLFHNCSVTQVLWILVLEWFECSWVFPLSLFTFFEAWMMGVGSSRGRILWKLSFLATMSVMEGKEYAML